jgi:hypothetical protein
MIDADGMIQKVELDLGTGGRVVVEQALCGMCDD